MPDAGPNEARVRTRDQDAWRARAYYAEGVKLRRLSSTGRRIGQPTDVGGKFALEVWAGSRAALQPDLDVFESRSDIGQVDVWYGPAYCHSSIVRAAPASPGEGE